MCHFVYRIGGNCHSECQLCDLTKGKSFGGFFVLVESEKFVSDFCSVQHVLFKMGPWEVALTVLSYSCKRDRRRHEIFSGMAGWSGWVGLSGSLKNFNIKKRNLKFRYLDFKWGRKDQVLFFCFVSVLLFLPSSLCNQVCRTEWRSGPDSCISLTETFLNLFSPSPLLPHF